MQTSPESKTIFPLTLVGSGSVPSCELGTSVCLPAVPVLAPRPGHSQLKGCVEGPTVLKKEVAMKNTAAFFDVNIKQEMQESSFGGTPLTL